MNHAERTQGGNISTVQQDLCTLHEKELFSIIFEDGLCCFARGGVKNTMAATFSRNSFAMLVICWVKTHMLRLLWRALKPRFTSWLMRPFTSFEAARSSRGSFPPRVAES